MRPAAWIGVAALAATRVLAAQGTVPGWEIASKTTMVMQIGGAPRTTEQTTKTLISGTHQRIDGLGGGSPMMPADAYVVTTPPMDSSFVVSPSTRTVRTMDPRGIVATSGIVLDPSTMSGAQVPAFEEVGDGGLVLGHRTRLYRAEVTTHMRLPMFGDSSVRSFTNVIKTWLATDATDPMIAGLLRDGALVARGAGLPAGIVLRSETTIIGLGATGTVSTTEVQSIRHVDIDTASFAVPNDYARVDMNAELRSMRERTNSMLRDLERDFPGMGANMRRSVDSLMGIKDTVRKKP